MTDARIGGAYLDFVTRNARFLAGLRRNGEALRRQQRAIRQLRRTVRNFNRSAGTMTRRLVSMRSAIGLLSGASGLGLLAKSQAKYGATLVETSERLGILVEDLQLLQRVFEGEGLAINQINIGLQRFTRRLADAQQGNEKLQATFRVLGTEIRNSDGSMRSALPVLFDVADGLSNLNSQQERVLRSFQLFDSEGVAFVNVLQQGSAALRESMVSFGRLGVVLTGEARRLKDLDQSYTDLGNAIRVGLARGVAKAAESFQRINEYFIDRLPEVVPQVVAFSEALIKGLSYIVDNADKIVTVIAAIAGLKFGATLGAAFGGPVGATIGAILGAATGAIVADKLYDQIRRLSEEGQIRAELAILNQRDALGEFSFIGGDPQEEQRRELQARLDALVAQREALEAQRLDEMVITGRRPPRPLGFGPEDIPAPAQPGRLFDNPYLQDTLNLFRQINKSAQDRLRHAEQQIDLSRVQGDQQELMRARFEALNQLKDQRLDLLAQQADAEERVRQAQVVGDTDALQASQRSLQQIQAAIAALHDRNAALDKYLETLREAVRLENLDARQQAHLARLAQAARAFGYAFEDAVILAINSTESMREALKALGRDLANYLLRVLFLQQIGGFLAGGIQRGLQGLFPGPGPDIAQHGGRHQGLTLVGEAGPELVDFRRPARVYPNETLREIAGGGEGRGQIVINFAPVIESDNEAAVERGLARAFPVFEANIRASIGTDLGRPSAFRNAGRRR